MADPKDKDKKDPKKDEKKDEKKDLGQAKDYQKKGKHKKGTLSGITFAGRGFVAFMFIVVGLFALIFVALSLYGEGAGKTTEGEQYSTEISAGEKKATVTADNTTVIYTRSNHPFYVLYDDGDGETKRYTVLSGNSSINYTCRVNDHWPWNVEIEGAHDSTKIQFNVVRGVKRRR